ncbi:unnamed protein product, partial [Durusdinium trenchii]
GRSACERLQAELDTWNNTESDMLILEIDGLFWEPLNVARYNVDVLVLCGSTSFLGDFLIQASAINLRFQALVTNLPAGAGKIFSYGAPLVNYILEPLPLGAILPTATDAVFGSLETFAQDLGDEPDVASLQVTVVASLFTQAVRSVGLSSVAGTMRTGNFETLFGIRGQWKPAFRQFLPSNDAALLPYDAPLAPGPLNSNVILVSPEVALSCQGGVLRGETGAVFGPGADTSVLELMLLMIGIRFGYTKSWMLEYLSHCNDSESSDQRGVAAAEDGGLVTASGRDGGRAARAGEALVGRYDTSGMSAVAKGVGSVSAWAAVAVVSRGSLSGRSAKTEEKHLKKRYLLFCEQLWKALSSDLGQDAAGVSMPVDGHFMEMAGGKGIYAATRAWNWAHGFQEWKKHIVFTRNVTNDPETHDEEMDFTDGGVRRLEYVGTQIIETQGHLVKCLEDGSVTGMARQRLTQALTAASVMTYID